MLWVWNSKIVKIPEHEVVVAFGSPQALAVGGVDLEQDLAIHQQCEQFDSGKAVLSPELVDFLRCATSAARAAAIFGSQILNNAPARGNSSTISSPRRRK